MPTLVAVFSTAVLLAGCGSSSDPGTACDPSARRIDSIEAYVAALSHLNAYAPLTVDQLNSVRAAARALAAGDAATASTMGASVGYDVVELTAPTGCYVALEPTAGGPAGQATLVIAHAYARDLVIEAPHVPSDYRTGEEAPLLFLGTQARAMIVAGAERCAITAPSGCHINHECNAEGIAVESDPSHSVKSAFHAMHLALATAGATSTTLQLHTNIYPSLNGTALVSNGTRYPIAGTAADAIHAALAAKGGDIRTCNDVTPPVTGSFCGETNAQSLASNGAGDACTGTTTHSGPASIHRFVQLEQNSQQLADIAGWSQTVADAINAGVPVQP